MFAKIVVAVCVSAGLVALVAGQNIDPQGCAQKVQAATEKYRKDMQNEVSKLTSGLASLQSEAVDVNGITADANKLTEALGNMVPSGGQFNPSQMASQYAQILQMQGGMMSHFNLGAGMKAARIYMQFIQSISQINGDFAMNAGSQCMPSLRANLEGQ